MKKLSGNAQPTGAIMRMLIFFALGLFCNSAIAQPGLADPYTTTCNPQHPAYNDCERQRQEAIRRIEAQRASPAAQSRATEAKRQSDFDECYRNNLGKAHLVCQQYMPERDRKMIADREEAFRQSREAADAQARAQSQKQKGRIY